MKHLRNKLEFVLTTHPYLAGMGNVSEMSSLPNVAKGPQILFLSL